jgi:hypothetical protein
MGRGGAGKTRRGGENSELAQSNDASGDENGKGQEDSSENTQHVAQPPIPSLPQAAISEDNTLIQSISRTIRDHSPPSSVSNLPDSNG